MRGEGRHCDLHLTEENGGLPEMTEHVGAELVLVGKETVRAGGEFKGHLSRHLFAASISSPGLLTLYYFPRLTLLHSFGTANALLFRTSLS